MHSSNVTWNMIRHKSVTASLLSFLHLLMSDEDYVINARIRIHVESDLHLLYIVTVTNNGQTFVPKSETTLKQWVH